MEIALIALLSLLTTLANAQTKPDETAIRKILEEQVAAWNRGDAYEYSKHFATDGIFTNVQGMYYTGYKPSATGMKSSSGDNFTEPLSNKRWCLFGSVAQASRWLIRLTGYRIP